MVIFLTVFIDLIGFGIIIPILQMYAVEFGATDLQAGILMGVFSAVQFFVIPVWGWLSDRLGRKPIILAGLAATVVSYLVLAYADSLWMLFFGRALAGFAAGNLVAAQAYVADVTTPEKRAQGMGFIGIAFGLGFILGPMIGGILSQVNFLLPFQVAAGFSAAALLFGLFVLEESLPPEKRGHGGPMRHPILDLGSFIRETQVFRVVSANFLFSTAFSMWETVLVLFVAQEVLVGDDPKGIAGKVGYLFAFAGLLSALIQGGAIRPLVKRYSENSLAKTGFLVLALGFLGFVAFYYWGREGRIYDLVPVLALTGLGIGLINPTLSSLASKIVSPRRQGEIFGAFRGIGSLGRVIGPILGAVLFASVSHMAPYLVGALLLLGSMTLLLGEFDFHPENT